MKILKLQNRRFIYLVYLFVLFINNILFANEPIDIWDIQIKKADETVKDKEAKTKNFYQKETDTENNIIIGQKLETTNIKLAGLYDPQSNGLKIDMWSNSDGEEIKILLEKNINRRLSKFSEKLLDIALLTNSYLPTKNITEEEFLEFKYDYLIQKKNLNLIKAFLENNPYIENNEKLIKFYADYFLALSETQNACEIFENAGSINNKYLNEFRIYCLINENKRDQAQLLFDLSGELDGIDNFFENKFNLLMQYTENDENISDENILYFHLSHRTNKKFEYRPNLNSPKFIWKYLSSSNILKNIETFDIKNPEEFKLIEIATNEGIYDEDELFQTYKKFQFNINQLINAEEIYKTLPSYEGRALLYQRLLLSVDIEQKLTFASLLLNSFQKSKLKNLFKNELKEILKSIEIENVPSNYTTFYDQNLKSNSIKERKIKINNKVIHQSKLLNYFLNKTSLPKVEKETNDMLKKFKRDKKYLFTQKDIILLETLKNDGIKIDKKYENLYQYKYKISPEFNNFIKNDELGLILLKIVDIIGDNELNQLDMDTLNLLIATFNRINNIDLRNEVLLEILPLKV